MNDPYNSYPPASPSLVVKPTAAVQAPQINDRVQSEIAKISRLDVSDKWKKRFHAIHRAGGPSLPQGRTLSSADKRLVNLNWLAFFFWPVYLPLKGLWRQAVAYFIIGIACIVIMELVGLGKFGRAVGYGIGAAAMLRANVGYYRRVVLGENSWI